MRDSKAFGLLKGYISLYRWYFIGGLISLILVDGMQLIVPQLVRKAIDSLSQTNPILGDILTFGIYILILAIGIGLTRFLWRYCIIGISRKIEEDLRNRFYRHLQRLSFTYFDKTSVGDLMAHATNDIEAIRMMIGMALIAMMDALLLSVASLVMLLSINVKLTLLVLFPLPFISFTFWRLGRVLHKRFLAVQAGFSRITEKAQETFAGIKVVKTFVQEAAESDNFYKLNKDYVRQNMLLTLTWGIFHPVIVTVVGICSVIILWYGGSQVIETRMSMGDFVAFNSYLGILIWPMIAIGWVANLYQRGKASLNRLQAIFSIAPEITDRPDAIERPISGEVEFRDFSFGYTPDRMALEHISLHIHPGEWIAIMGPTGSSKSTLVNLIPRLYNPPENSLFIEGVDVHHWKLESLRSQVAFVPQQTFLFSDSISNNIKFGLDISDEAIHDAAAVSQLLDEVALFPDGMNTVVGEKGVTLSGGQKQRVAIARAIVREAPIYIFDDALSSVDAETESHIISELRKRLKGKTVLFITHRVSLARYTDRIIFLVDGSIVEQGSHQELLDLRGNYFEIYEHQRLLEEIDRAAEATLPGQEV